MIRFKNLLFIIVLTCTHVQVFFFSEATAQTAEGSFSYASSCEGRIVAAASVQSYPLTYVLELSANTSLQQELVNDWKKLNNHFRVCTTLSAEKKKGNKGNSNKELNTLIELQNSLNKMFLPETDGLVNEDSIRILVNGMPINHGEKMNGDRAFFRYPQDTYQLFQNADTSIVLTNYRKEGYDNHEPIVNKNSCITSNGFSRLALDGGNIHVLGEIAFVGHNALREGYDISQAKTDLHKELIIDRLERIGCTKNSSLETVIDSIEKVLGVKSIVWVGTEQKSCLNRLDGEAFEYAGKVECNTLSGWQPFYHSDLFFHPVSFSQGKDSVEFRYFVADASLKKWQNQKELKNKEGFKRKIELLESSLRKTEKFLREQCQLLGIKAVPIRVPMHIVPSMGGEFLNVYAFVNGLMDGSRFFMPAYKYNTSNEYKTAFGAAKQVLKTNLKQFGDRELVIVESPYGSKSALRCELFVSKRVFD